MSSFGNWLATKYPNRTFWSLFLLLNFLLFVPIYLFFREDASFWPVTWRASASLPDVLRALLLQRENPDIFRLNLELTLFVALWVFVKPLRQPAFVTFAFLVYLAQILYAFYEGFIRSYYLLDPVLYNDIQLFSNGTAFVLESLHLSPVLYAAGALGLAGLVSLFYRLTRLILGGIAPEQLSGSTRLLLGVMTAAAVVSVVGYHHNTWGLETAVSSFTAKLSHNFTLSREARAEAKRFNIDHLLPYYDFTDSTLAQKPDIYIIFIESYGSVLFKRGDFYARYRTTLNLLEDRLAENNWHVTSTRSEAPTWGGGSWISYTSALAGLRLDSHAQYQIFLNQHQKRPFPHLFNYLRDQGYRSYRLSGMAADIDNATWAQYQTFYGIDEWIRFEEVEYTGPLYGWGPALPDQYAINYAHDRINSRPDEPAVFFYITQNSHYPWTPLPEIVPDWRTLNDLPAAAAIDPQNHQEMRRQYLTSIQYELEMLVDFITSTADEDDIFVLIGDHQPSRVARYADGWDTPVHIISRDRAFTDAFAAYGFVPGMNTRTIDPQMRHEGFYTLFVRTLLQQYGADPTNLPPYMPDGVPIH